MRSIFENTTRGRSRWLLLMGAAFLLFATCRAFAQPAPLSPQDAERLLEMHSSIAWQTLYQGRLELAEMMFRDILQRDPSRPQEIAGLASALAQRGKIDESIELLRTATREFPGNSSLVSMLGQAYLSAGKNSAAMNSFERAYRLDADLPDVGYFLGSTYLNCQYPLMALDAMCGAPTSGDGIRWSQDLGIGLAFSQLSLQSQASGYFRRVAREAADTPLAEQALALQDQLNESVFDRPLVSGSLKVTERYDTNPGVIPAANFGGGALSVQPSAGNQFVGEISVVLSRDYNYDLTAGYTFYHTANYKTHQFDIMDNGAFLAIDRRAYWLGMPTFAGLRLNYDHLLIGSDDFLQRVLATPTLTFMHSDWVSTTFLMRYGLFDFRSQGALAGTPFDLDADNIMFGLQRQWQLACRKLSVYSGYQYDHNFAEGADYDFNGHKLLAGLTWITPWRDMRINAQGEMYWRGYVNPDSVFGVIRDDEEYTVDVSVVYPLRDDWNLWLSLNLDHNDSNLVTNDYRRQVMDMGLEYRFGQSR